MNKQRFNTGWEFTELTGFAAMFNPHAWQPVVLPHDAMISKSRHPDNPTGNQGAYFPGSVAHYRRKFKVPAEWRGQSVQVEFEGVYMNAEIAVNDQKMIAFHPYGYTSFIVDITEYLKYGEENMINVVANNTAQPNCRWYAGTGIYRNVWLRRGHQIHIQPWGVSVTTPVVEKNNAVVQVETEIANLTCIDHAVLRSTIYAANGEAIASTLSNAKHSPLHQTLLVTDPALWSIAAPNLYTLCSEVLIDGKVIDEEKTTFGIRSISVDPKNGLRLNGKTIKMKGGCIHHAHGPLGAASYDRAEERKVEILKSGGYNAIRTAHNPPSPALLDACDRLGMLVINETFDAWTSPKVTNDYHLNFKEWWQRDTESMVKRDRNHPSVIMWSTGNEIFEALGSPVGTEWSRRITDYIRSLDSTRPITCGVMINFIENIAKKKEGDSFSANPVPEKIEEDSWGNQTADFIEPLDVAGYNYMAERYAVDRTRFPNRVIAGTETWGHRMFTFWKETVENSQVIGDFVWTAMDYLGEAGGGMVSFDGVRPRGAPFPWHTSGIGDFNICGFKRVQSYYRDLLWGLRTAPFIAIVDPQHHGKPMMFAPWAWEAVLDTWTFPGQEGKLCQVDVYSIDDEVEVFVNGVSAGKKPAGASVQNKVSFDVEYQPGKIEAVGYKDGKETGRFHLVTTTEPTALNLSVDRAVIEAGYGDIAYVTVEMVDASGNLVKNGDSQVSISVSGPGDLIAIGSGNPSSEESYVGNQHQTFQGRLLAVIRSTDEVGQITVTAQCETLSPTSIQINSK